MLFTFHITQSWRLTTDAVITELFICQGPDPITGEPTDVMHKISRLTEPIFACGYLKTSDKDSLSFYLFKEKIQKPIYSNHPSSEYSEGYFFWELSLGEKPLPGLYTVEVYLARNKLASTNFTIIEP